MEVQVRPQTIPWTIWTERWWTILSVHYRSRNVSLEVEVDIRAEAEVDIETGAVHLLRYVALQDSGRLLNPLLVEGQVHGSVVHGIGNALFEFMRYDAQGQPQSGTFADYLLPTAPEMPPIEVILTETPTPDNPLGAKGVGETGMLPVTAAVIGAIEHALDPLGIRIEETPLSPVRLLELIRHARKGHA